MGATDLTYEVLAPGGTLRLIAGQQMFQLEGVGCWLGYAPRLTNGQLLVHRLDARKNLWPLADRQGATPLGSRAIVIDPGHGGDNRGTPSVLPRVFEKDLTLDWALRLRPLLASNGWQVILTRTNDVDVSLAERVALAEHARAACFISLHFNSAPTRQEQAGLETFCLTPAGLPSTLTRDYEDDPTRVYPNNSFDDANLTLAYQLHCALLERTGAADRGIRRARFMGVLRGQNRPAVLLEAGYLSNPQEARQITRPEYRQRLAEAVVQAVGPAPTGRQLTWNK
jgi:N-acetylmuramoyl-L-alanine amidase